MINLSLFPLLPPSPFPQAGQDSEGLGEVGIRVENFK
jgi:hypothetical protein